MVNLCLVRFKYVQAATRTGQIRKVIVRVTSTTQEFPQGSRTRGSANHQESAIVCRRGSSPLTSLSTRSRLAMTNDNSMFKWRATYLVKRRGLELRHRVLNPNTDHRRRLTDQVSVQLSSCSWMVHWEHCCHHKGCCCRHPRMCYSSPFSDNENPSC